MTENEIANRVMDAAFQNRRGLGPGFLESVYEGILAHKVADSGLVVERQGPVPIRYQGIILNEG